MPSDPELKCSVGGSTYNQPALTWPLVMVRPPSKKTWKTPVEPTRAVMPVL